MKQTFRKYAKPQTALPTFRESITAVKETDTDNFIALVELTGYDPAKDFQFRDLNDANFKGCDLNGFNFTGSRMTAANFSGSKICGAIFDGRQKRLIALKSATDYAEFMQLEKQKSNQPAQKP